jgi:hypothetical protein
VEVATLKTMSNGLNVLIVGWVSIKLAKVNKLFILSACAKKKSRVLA